MLETSLLTERQQQILTLIRNSIRNTGYPPTRAEIANQLGFKSANAAEEHLQALERKGVITLKRGSSRAIRIIEDDTSHSAPKQIAFDSFNQLALPLIGRVAAGSPVLAEEHVEQTVHLAAQMFSSTPNYLLRVKGMSMRDAGILDGDLIAVKQATDAENKTIVVARLDNEVTVKRLLRQRNEIHLLPENPDFSPIIIKANQPNFALEGIVVGLVRPQIR